MDNSTDNQVESVNLTDIDWNKLSVSEFRELEKKLQDNNKFLKTVKEKKTRVSGVKQIKVRGSIYEVPAVLAERLKSLKSQKSKDKLLDEIVSTFNPITDFTL